MYELGLWAGYWIVYLRGLAYQRAGDGCEHCGIRENTKPARARPLQPADPAGRTFRLRVRPPPHVTSREAVRSTTAFFPCGVGPTRTLPSSLKLAANWRTFLSNHLSHPVVAQAARQPSLTLKPAAQRSAIDEWHDVERQAVGGARVEERQDVRVPKMGGGANLGDEAVSADDRPGRGSGLWSQPHARA